MFHKNTVQAIMNFLNEILVNYIENLDFYENLILQKFCSIQYVTRKVHMYVCALTIQESIDSYVVTMAIVSKSKVRAKLLC